MDGSVKLAADLPPAAVVPAGIGGNDKYMQKSLMNQKSFNTILPITCPPSSNACTLRKFSALIGDRT